MTRAYVTVSNYGNDTHVRCHDCGVDETHDRHKPAATAAQAHNDLEHPATTGDPK